MERCAFLMLNLLLFLSTWKRRRSTVCIAKRCISTLLMAVSSAPFLFSTLSVLAVLNWRKAPAHCGCVSGLALNFAAAVGISSGSTYSSVIAGSSAFCIHSGSPVFIFTHLFFIRLLQDCSDKEAWAQLQKDGRNADAILIVSTPNSFCKDIVKF